MPDPSSALHTISGLDDRDLALLAAACADLATHLTHLAAGRRYHAGYHPDNPDQASNDADRLNYIATTLVGAFNTAEPGADPRGDRVPLREHQTLPRPLRPPQSRLTPQIS